MKSKSYLPGAYTTFLIHDPKQRMISTAPFRDRVVHHALVNVIEPIFEKTFVHDSYANRKGKGTHRAIERYQHYARRYSWVLKCDIRKFFPSVDHAVLKREIRWKIACPDTLWLCDRIIDGSNTQEAPGVYWPGDYCLPGAAEAQIWPRRGLPIGNLTSQFWANVYLNRFDHFVRETLRAPGYVRYVDDFVLFSDDKNWLQAVQAPLSDFLAVQRLALHADKTHVHATERGVPFLGFRVWPHYRVVKKEKTRRFERYLRHQLSAPVPDGDRLEASLNSWRGHVRFGQHARLCYRVFWRVKAAGVPLFGHPNDSWRVLCRA
ncbi:MAG: group II intron reverse transcriptase domain-containing protein [Saprospiraceae bacterium]|nr:group II intron reverse transcriptase domain-containing protein [Saprospiraceae bacterium]